MPRTATGHVVVKKTSRGIVYGARFPAYGVKRYQTLGAAADGMTREAAELALADILADVRRGIWRPAQREPVEAPRDVPTFHEFASEWFERQRLEGGRHGGGLTKAGAVDLEWRLTYHLLPHFAGVRLDAITVEDVDRFRLAKVRERDAIDKAAAAGKPLMEDYTDPRTGRAWQRRRTAIAPGSINKLIGTLAAILEAACEYEIIARNVARGRRRRLAATRPVRAWIDRAEHVEALLEAARTLDLDARARHGQRRALLATLTFAGLRIGEALALRWRDVDLARGTITVGHAKTDAGVRTVNVLPVLRDELDAYCAQVSHDADALVFGTASGASLGATNVRRRVLAPAVLIASGQLAKAGRDALPAGLTPHSLRRTFASILFAIGEAPPYVMAQMGHTRPAFTLALYARAMNRRDGEPERLRALVEGANWQRIGSSGNVVELADRTRQTA